MVSDLRRCRHGHEVPDGASLCPTCGDGSSVSGSDPGPGEPAGGWGWIVAGVLVAPIGWLMWVGALPREAGQALVGLTAFILGLVLLGVGVVAQGVLVGLRRWHHESRSAGQ